MQAADIAEETTAGAVFNDACELERVQVIAYALNACNLHDPC